MWSARPRGIEDDRRTTNDGNLDEHRRTIRQRRNGPATMPRPARSTRLTNVGESLGNHAWLGRIR